MRLRLSVKQKIDPKNTNIFDKYDRNILYMVQRFRVTFTDETRFKQAIKLEGDDEISLRFVSGEGSSFNVNEIDTNENPEKYLLANVVIFGQGVDSQAN